MPTAPFASARRVRGGARRRRSARDVRRLHRARDRLGRDARLPAASLEATASPSPRRWTPRSAAVGLDVDVGAGADPPRAGRGARRRRRRSRAARARIISRRRPASRSTTSQRAYEEQVGYVEGDGGRVILMASRALAQRRAHAPTTTARLRRRPAPGEAAGDPALARRHVRSAARRLLGHADARRGDGRLPRRHRDAPREGGRHQDLAARRAA